MVGGGSDSVPTDARCFHRLHKQALSERDTEGSFIRRAQTRGRAAAPLPTPGPAPGDGDGDGGAGAELAGGAEPPPDPVWAGAGARPHEPVPGVPVCECSR